MLGRLSHALMLLGLVISMLAIPVSIYVNGDQIWTKEGQVAGNYTFMIGCAVAAAGFLIVLVDYVLDATDV